MREFKNALLLIIGLTGVHLVGSEPERGCPPIVGRSEWNALPPKAITYMPIPVERVLIGFTRTKECFTKENCTEIVQKLQRKHMRKKSTNDIIYSFLIGGDERVYEGAGWHKSFASASDKSFRKIISIIFIGKVRDIQPNEKMMDALKSLISCGVRHGEIHRDYVLTSEIFNVEELSDNKRCEALCKK